LVGIASDACGFDLHERYRNLPDLHVSAEKFSLG